MILGEHVEPVYNLCMGLLRTLDSFEALTQLRICSNPVLYILPAKLSQNFPYNDNNIQFSYVLLFRDCISHACFWRLVNTTMFMFTGINPWCCRYLGSVSHCSHKLNISSSRQQFPAYWWTNSESWAFLYSLTRRHGYYFLFLCFSLFPLPFSLLVALFVVVHHPTTRWGHVYKLRHNS